MGGREPAAGLDPRPVGVVDAPWGSIRASCRVNGAGLINEAIAQA
jgi:hypothetical protein